MDIDANAELPPRNITRAFPHPFGCTSGNMCLEAFEGLWRWAKEWAGFWISFNAYYPKYPFVQ